MKIQRGDIFIADLNETEGSEQGGVRPVLIIQNNRGNKHSPTTIVASITSRAYTKAPLPTHYYLPPIKGMKKQSLVMLEQIRVVDKSRLQKKVAHLTRKQMIPINKRILISFGVTISSLKRTVRKAM